MAALCEYMFRLGAYDSAKLCDPEAALRFAERDDKYEELRLLSRPGTAFSDLAYSDFLLLTCRLDMPLPSLANFLSKYGMNMHIKRGLCHICDFYYRKGVRYGARLSLDEAEEFLNTVNRGREHPYTYQRKLSHKAFVDCIRIECTELARTTNVPIKSFFLYMTTAQQNYNKEQEDKQFHKMAKKSNNLYRL